MPPGQRITLVAAGAGAGIAATFNTPIGGVMFAIELMMPEVSVATFLPVALATGTATFVGRLFFGSQPAFDVPHLAPLADDATTAAVTAGALRRARRVDGSGGDRLHPRPAPRRGRCSTRSHSRYLRHMLGMLLVGVLIYVLLRSVGHYYVEGVGYATIQAILIGH